MHLTLFIVFTIVVSSAVIFKQYMQFIGFSIVATGVEIFLSTFNNRWAFSYIFCTYLWRKEARIKFESLIKVYTQMNYEMVHWEKECSFALYTRLVKVHIF